MLDRKTRDELTELSAKFLGKPNAWRKLVDKGVLVDELDDEGKPKTHNGIPYKRVQHIDPIKLLQDLRNAKAKQEQEQAQKQVERMASGKAK